MASDARYAAGEARARCREAGAALRRFVGGGRASAAAIAFAEAHPEFELEQPAWLFNESTLSENITHWPEAWLKRVS